jgi:hypothetical protein
LSNPTYSIFDAPTREEVYAYILALFPSGPAWQSDDVSTPRENSVLKQFVWGLSGPVWEFEVACVNTLKQFFCSMATDDLDLWVQDYANPSGCEPLDGAELCAKVSAIGGTSIAYLEELAEKAGWVVSVSYAPPATVNIEIDAAHSPFLNDVFTLDESELDDVPLGDPDTSTIECLLDNAIPAHLHANYTVI